MVKKVESKNLWFDWVASTVTDGEEGVWKSEYKRKIKNYKGTIPPNWVTNKLILTWFHKWLGVFSVRLCLKSWFNLTQLLKRKKLKNVYF